MHFEHRRWSLLQLEVGRSLRCADVDVDVETTAGRRVQAHKSSTQRSAVTPGPELGRPGIFMCNVEACMNVDEAENGTKGLDYDRINEGDEEGETYLETRKSNDIVKGSG